MADASAVLDYLLSASDYVRRTVRTPGADLHVPALCDVEVGSGLRGALLSKDISKARAIEAMDDYLDLPLTRHGHQSLLRRMLELHANFSAYDAAYVALAEQLGAGLLTGDQRLARSAKTHTHVSIIA